MSAEVFRIAVVGLLVAGIAVVGLLVWYVRWDRRRDDSPVEAVMNAVAEPRLGRLAGDPPGVQVEEVLAEALESEDIGWLTAGALARVCREALENADILTAFYRQVVQLAVPDFDADLAALNKHLRTRGDLP